MRSGCGTATVIVWLLIGTLAAGQRGYYDGSIHTCTKIGTTLLSIVAGPLNYLGVNPQMTCQAPQPSK